MAEEPAQTEQELGEITSHICAHCGRSPQLFFGLPKAEHVKLCLDCYLKYLEMGQIQINERARMYNLLSAPMNRYTAGILPPKPPLPIIPPRGGDVVYNNFEITSSNIGVINAGTAQKIDVVITGLRQHGSTDLAEALKQFTNAVLNSGELEPAARKDLLDQLTYLSEQVAAPAEQHSPSIANFALTSIHQAVTGLAALSTLWNNLAPL